MVTGPKKIPGWEEHAVRVKLHNVLAAELSQEAELAAFPQPLILTLVQEFTAHELLSCQFPGGSWCESDHCYDLG